LRIAREFADALVQVIHGHGDACARGLEDFLLDHLPVFADELDGQRSLAGILEVGGLVLIAEGMAADNDRLCPAGDEAGNVLADDGFAEDHSAEDVADRAVRALPHFLQPELRNARFVGRDGGALDADAVLLDGVGRVDRHLVGGLVAILDRQVVIVEVHIEVGVNQLVLDVLPDDAGHLVAVEFHDGAGHLDFRHSNGPVGWCGVISCGGRD
jgi:hypothetical protein